jgi:CHASE2 domain-containing sensor protein
MKLGKAIFLPFQANDGGYIGARNPRTVHNL